MTQAPGAAVFISYASQDAEVARRIAEALQGVGVEVWFDESALKGGAAWDGEIRRQIHDCALFLPVISAHTEARLEGYFRLEWRLAEQRSHQIAEGKAFAIPVVIDQTQETGAHVPRSFLDVQWTRLPVGEGATAFAKHVKLLLDTPTPLPAVSLTVAQAAPSHRASLPRSKSRVPWLIGAAALLICAVAAAILVQWRADRSQPAASAGTTPAPAALPRTAVAVLPFANLTGDGSKEYLGDGMAEELINTLTKVPGLKVPARTSTFAYKGRNTDIRQIAKDLGVGTILEGSVRAAGKRLRITAQLIDAQDGLHLWSESYGEEFTDIFKLQDKLSTQIAAALQVNLVASGSTAPAQTAGTTDVEAYSLVLQGSSLADEGAVEQWRRAAGLFHQAIQRDPHYARAWSGLSGVHFGLSTVLRSDVEWTESERAARRALELDAGDTLAHVYLGQLISSTDNFVAAEDRYRAALTVAPNDSFTHSVYVSQLARAGRLGTALFEARKGYALAPASAYAIGRLAQALSLNDLDTEAAKWAGIARAMYGGNGVGFLSFKATEFRTALREGRLDAAADAAVAVAAPAQLDKSDIRLLIAATVDTAKQTAAVAIKDRFNNARSGASRPGGRVTYQWYADSAPACTAAYLYGIGGALDAAYEMAGRCLPAPVGLGLSVGDLWVSEMAAFRRDPRFADYIERLGLHLIDYWQKYGPPDGCRLNGRKLSCS